LNRRMPVLPLQADGVYLWVGPRMGRTLFGTKLGSLVFTGTHLAFVTAGGNDVPARLVMATLSGLLPTEAGVALGVAEAARGPLARILRSSGSASSASRRQPPTGPGSWIAPLPAISRCEHVLNGFSSYLAVSIRQPTHDVHFAVGRQTAFVEGSEFERAVAALA
jgi:hypothetical protein